MSLYLKQQIQELSDLYYKMVARKKYEIAGDILADLNEKLGQQSRYEMTLNTLNGK